MLILNESKRKKLTILTKHHKALGNKKRCMILILLSQYETIPVWFIAQEIELSIKSTSKHLLILSQAHLVRSSRKKIEMHYSLPKPTPITLKTFLKEFQ